MATRKKEAFYFDCPKARRVGQGLRDGGIARFYRGRPELNPITDERDVEACRKRPDLVEVKQITVGKKLVWVPAAEADRRIAQKIGAAVPTFPTPVASPADAGAARNVPTAQPRVRAVVPVQAQDEAVVTLDDKIANVILTKLDKDNPEHFTQGGKPQVKAIADILNIEISAGDRNRVWAEIGE